MIDPVWNPAWIDAGLDSRAATFENPTGARGAGGTAHGGRKGAPNRRIRRDERVVLADIEGPGVVRHIWMTFMPAPPEQMFFAEGQDAELEAYERTNPVAGEGWIRGLAPGMLAFGIAERVDDYCATAYVYCNEPQPVPPLDVAGALADIERRPGEGVLPAEALAGIVSAAEAGDGT